MTSKDPGATCSARDSERRKPTAKPPKPTRSTAAGLVANSYRVIPGRRLKQGALPVVSERVARWLMAAADVASNAPLP